MTQASSENTLSNGHTNAPLPPQQSRKTDEVEKDKDDVERKLHGGSEPPDTERNRNIGGEKADNEPPSPVGFWDSSLNNVRKSVILLWARTSKSCSLC